MSEKDGGPAFPIPEVHCEGMSLRDYFAGQVLAGALANPATMMDAENDEHTQQLASIVYTVADAMLRARETQDD